MLRQFVTLSKGDFVVQNGANSAVGETATSIIDTIQTRGSRFRTGRDPDCSSAWVQDDKLCAQQV